MFVPLFLYKVGLIQGPIFYGSSVKWVGRSRRLCLCNRQAGRPLPTASPRPRLWVRATPMRRATGFRHLPIIRMNHKYSNHSGVPEVKLFAGYSDSSVLPYNTPDAVKITVINDGGAFGEYYLPRNALR